MHTQNTHTRTPSRWGLVKTKTAAALTNKLTVPLREGREHLDADVCSKYCGSTCNLMKSSECRGRSWPLLLKGNLLSLLLENRMSYHFCEILKKKNNKKKTAALMYARILIIKLFFLVVLIDVIILHIISIRLRIQNYIEPVICLRAG